MNFSFGQSEHERIVIDVGSYERDVAGDFHDDNWIIIRVFVSVGGFKGTVGATIITDELVTFHEELCTLYDTLKGEAKFTTLEQQLALTLVSNTRGNIQLKGQVMDRAGVGNKLSFTLKFDQTQLAASINELAAVMEAFPVRIPKQQE